MTHQINDKKNTPHMKIDQTRHKINLHHSYMTYGLNKDSCILICIFCFLDAELTHHHLGNWNARKVALHKTE